MTPDPDATRPGRGRAAGDGGARKPAGDPGARNPAGDPTAATNGFDGFILRTIAATGRVVRSWRALDPKQRLAGYAAFGLFIGLFLPWYSQTVVAGGAKAPVQARSVSLNGWDAFSLVQAVALLVSVGVLTLLFQRGDGRTYRLPGGDGATIMVAGSITSVLIVWGIFDQPGAAGRGQYTTATGIEWGILIELALAALLAYSGSQLRLAPYRAPRIRPDRPARPTQSERPRRAAPADDTTRISTRAPYDQPTPVSTKRSPVDSPTRVSRRRPARDAPTERIGPEIVPDDPPTTEIRRLRPPASKPPDQE